MKRVLLPLFILILGSSFCFAQKADAPAKSAASKEVELKVLIGKVESATLADTAKGTKSEIVIVGDNDKKTTFLVKSTTTIYDKDGKAITLDKIGKDEKVKVKYKTTKEGVNETMSIKIVKSINVVK